MVMRDIGALGDQKVAFDESLCGPSQVTAVSVLDLGNGVSIRGPL